MRAALVTSFDNPPTCQDIPAPSPSGADELLVDVLASGLHPRVRSQADASSQHCACRGKRPVAHRRGHEPRHARGPRYGGARSSRKARASSYWARPAERARWPSRSPVGSGRAVVTGRTDRARPLTWVEIGSVAGPTAAIPSAALRAARLQIVGSGQGSVPTRDILAELPTLAAEIASGTFRLDVRATPLTDVETAWKDTTGEHRIVITP